ncbi:MAG TPA: alpha/beta fold hydrolase [Bryobacteraceae bacterium]
MNSMRGIGIGGSGDGVDDIHMFVIIFRMWTEECAVEVGAERLAATKIYAATGQPPSVISFHGAGSTATRARIRYVLDYFAEHGVSSACFDFSGHGESTGNMARANLRMREQEARAVAEFLNCQNLRAIIGTSMGAHIAAILAPALKPRSLILFCPAAYPQDAMDLPFDSAFTEMVRQPGAYVNSPAFPALHAFPGDLLIIAGKQDAVIPREVVDLYIESAAMARSKKVIWLEECGHQIHPWLQQHAEERDAVLRDVLVTSQYRM